MDEITSEFYVLLPSNSSTDFFPSNTQSSYRTKLSTPLALNSGDWQVGLAEIFIPKNWFNIGDHNNTYFVTHETEVATPTDQIVHEIRVITGNEFQTYNELFLKFNSLISEKVGDVVHFIPDADKNYVLVDTRPGYEIIVDPKKAKNLYTAFVTYPERVEGKNKVASGSSRWKANLNILNNGKLKNLNEVFTIINKNPKSVTTHLVPLVYIKDEMRNPSDTVFEVINKNLRILKLDNYVKFALDHLRNEVEITVSQYSKLRITRDKSSSLMNKLSIIQNVDLQGTNTFKDNPLISVTDGELIELEISEYYSIIQTIKNTREITITPGAYKTALSLFREFEDVHLQLLPNLKVAMEVSSGFEIELTKGLADMLGYKKTRFGSGRYIGDYAFELDGGISEIFVYTDIVQSSHVGDSFSPILRVVPCGMDKTSDHIVERYETPIYFNLKSNFIQEINIDLRNTAGSNIIFTGGKTFVMLSFRRRKRNDFV